jgi:small subunit ribosomal protein S11
MAEKKVKKKVRKSVTSGRVYIQSTYNNTIVTFTDTKGNALSWGSSGASGFKGPKKSTPYAASMACNSAAEVCKGYGLQEVEVFVKGVGTGREQAIRSIQANGISILSIRDVTPIPHGGCRPKKVRRA